MQTKMQNQTVDQAANRELTWEAQTLSKDTPGVKHVNFTAGKFTQAPVVIATAFNKGLGGVGSIVTVTDITIAGCTIIDQNHGNDYYINVLAIEQGTGQFGVGSTQIIAGQKPKEERFLNIPFDPAFESNSPIVLLSPFWNGSTQPIGSIETLDFDSGSKAVVVSNNMLPDYYVNYMAIDRGLDEDCMQAGTVNKTGGGLQRVYFPKPFPKSANGEPVQPIVLLTPWYDQKNIHTGHIETLVYSTHEYFEYTSSNAQTDFYVSWVAIVPGV